MNLYITFSNKDKIKRSFLNLRKYLVISTPDVIEALGLEQEKLDNCSFFLINEELKRLIQKGSVRKKLLSIIYSNPDMNDETIREIIHYATAISSIDQVIFLTDAGEYENYYELFAEIAYYPSIKKVHVLQCAIHAQQLQ